MVSSVGALKGWRPGRSQPKNCSIKCKRKGLDRVTAPISGWQIINEVNLAGYAWASELGPNQLWGLTTMSSLPSNPIGENLISFENIATESSGGPMTAHSWTDG